MPRMIVKEIVRDLYLLRIDDDKTRYFEALWDIPEGITYNAYLLMAGDSAILFDSWKRGYSEEFIEQLKRIVDPREIGYIVIHHMEQDHSGAIPRVLEDNGNKALVLGHPLARAMLRAFYGIEPKFRAVKDGEELVVGEKRIRFIHTPWLHWPETIMSFIEDGGILLSGDAFGAYSTPPSIFDDDDSVVAEYMKSARKYLANVIGHYRTFIVRNIEKIREQRISPTVVAPAHGLVFKNNPRAILDYYEKLARGVPEENKVVVVYSSMYGNVEAAISEAVGELRRRGMEPVVHSFTDSNRSPISEVLSDVIDASAVIIGAATYEADVFPYMRYLLDVVAEKAKVEKPVLIISSYGWGGVAGMRLSKKLEEMGFRVAGKVEFRGYPREEDLEKVREAVGVLLGSAQG